MIYVQEKRRQIVYDINSKIGFILSSMFIISLPAFFRFHVFVPILIGCDAQLRYCYTVLKTLIRMMIQRASCKMCLHYHWLIKFTQPAESTKEHDQISEIQSNVLLFPILCLDTEDFLVIILTDASSKIPPYTYNYTLC